MITRPLRLANLALAASTLCLPAAADIGSGTGPTVGLMCFDGIDDRVEVSYSASFPVDVFTAGAWIRGKGQGVYEAIVSRGEDLSSDNAPWSLYVDPNGFFVCQTEDAGDNDQVYASTTFVADNEWHHVAATRDAAGTLTLYVDGCSVATFANTNVPSPNNTQLLTIGCTIGVSVPPSPVRSHFYEGMIDEVAIWSAPLSAPEVQSVFSNGVDPLSADLRGYWSLDAVGGQSVIDSSPLGNHGVLGVDSSTEASDPLRTPVVAATETVRLGTPTNPDALRPGRTGGPVVGGVWAPFIDHTSFFPAAVLDFVFVSTDPPINIPISSGTLLCELPASPQIFFGSAGTTFSIQVPSDCAFVGVSICSQGVSFAPGAIELTNALDLVVGNR